MSPTLSQPQHRRARTTRPTRLRIGSSSIMMIERQHRKKTFVHHASSIRNQESHIFYNYATSCAYISNNALLANGTFFRTEGEGPPMLNPCCPTLHSATLSRPRLIRRGIEVNDKGSVELAGKPLRWGTKVWIFPKSLTWARNVLPQ